MNEIKRLPEPRFLAIEVAIAVLDDEGCVGYNSGGMHIDELTKKVCESKLSTLGLRCQGNPRQSLRSQLDKHREIFISMGEGRYCLNENKEAWDNYKTKNARAWLEMQYARIAPTATPTVYQG